MKVQPVLTNKFRDTRSSSSHKLDDGFNHMNKQVSDR